MTQSKHQTAELLTQLGKDIRYLGNILGTIIQDQQGSNVFDLVEEVRAAAKQRRTGDPAATQKLETIINQTNLQNKNALVKAFSNYFQLINIAEDQQRIRTLRDREFSNSLKESLDKAIEELMKKGTSASELRALIDRLRVRLVLTAHPSEAKRQEVLVKLTDIADMMAIRERQRLLPHEEEHYQGAITRRVEQLWQTRPTRATKATVADEVEFGLHFITRHIMDVVVSLHLEFRKSLQKYYPDYDWSNLPPILSFASWIGGDRDGNPNVTPEVTLETLKELRAAARDVYLQDVEYITARLTQSIDEVNISPEMQQLTEMYVNGGNKYVGEPYRQHLAHIAEKLENDAYANGTALLNDLLPIYTSLKENGAEHSADGTLVRLIIKVELFGLHLVPLDIREDTRHHTVAINEIFREYNISSNFSSLPEAEKLKILTTELANHRPLFPIKPEFSEITNRIINTWRMIATAHNKYGAEVIDTYIGSMSQEASDVLIMTLFAKEVGLHKDLDIVPLFETVDDLKHAPDVMQLLFDNPQYAEHLQCRNRKQQIMIGYSDSNKDGGYIASNWNLYEAQQNLAVVCRNNKVVLELFHGRGGSIGRGGGPTNRAILSQPPSSIQGPIKITEQGEVIAYRYANNEIARRHLNQVMHATLLATSNSTDAKINPDWIKAIRFLSENSREAYRKFVYETPGFLDYWQQATPINELASMPIGSRPAKRKKWL